MITAINVEPKQRFISSIKYHNKYYALNISCIFAYYVHYTSTCMLYFACFIHLFVFFKKVRPSSIDLLSINSIHVHHLPCKSYIIRKEFSTLFRLERKRTMLLIGPVNAVNTETRLRINKYSSFLSVYFLERNHKSCWCTQ